MRLLVSRALRLFLAIFVIAVGLLAAVPNQQCHCRDTKPVQTLKDDCPFGKLRLLTGSLDVATPLPIEASQVATEQASQFHYLVTALETVRETSARDPPLLA